MPSSTRRVVKVCTGASSPGPIAQVASVPLVTARSTSVLSFQSLRSTDLMAGPLWNGSAASKVRNRELARGAPFIQNHIIQTAARAFDDFASASTDQQMLNSILKLKRDKA